MTNLANGYNYINFELLTLVVLGFYNRTTLSIQFLCHLVIWTQFQEQANEREQERDEFVREVEKLKKSLSDQEKKQAAENRLQREVRYNHRAIMIKYNDRAIYRNMTTGQ